MNQQDIGLSKISKSTSDTKLKKYYSINAAQEVLGCLINNPQLLTKYHLELQDFVEYLHKLIFGIILNLSREGFNKIDADIIYEYLKDYPQKMRIFEKYNGVEYIQEISELCSKENFLSNYEEVRKWSVLRALVLAGIDVSEFFDSELIYSINGEHEDKQVEELREKFEHTSLEGIIQWYKNKVYSIEQHYNNDLASQSRKAGGEDAKRQKELWKVKKDIGLSYSSNFLTTVTKGLRSGRFTLMSAPSGFGKSIITVSNMCHTFAPKYYDKEKGKWLDNPHGMYNSCLYIGTEMELLEEVEPIIWAYMADVPEDNITQNNYAKGEEERVDQAIEYLTECTTNKSGIYLEYLPNFTVKSLEETIAKHCNEHGVTAVFFDYIHSTDALIAEYQASVGGKMAVREDQVLANLSNKLKNMARDYGVSIDTWTQVSGDYKNERNRDATVIRGAKAIADKIDVGGVLLAPTDTEKKAIRSIDAYRKNLNMPEPNVSMSIYKNRGGRYSMIKIWVYFDYATARMHDLFCTTWDYKPIPMPQTYTIVDENGVIKPFFDKNEIDKYSDEEKELLRQAEEYTHHEPLLETIDEEDLKNNGENNGDNNIDDDDDDFNY